MTSQELEMATHPWGWGGEGEGLIRLPEFQKNSIGTKAPSNNNL